MTIKCEKCANRTACEYVPYDVECDENFKEALTREQMIDNLIRKYGFENTVVLMFAKMCEEYEDSAINNDLIRIFYENNMAAKVGE